MVQVSGSSFRWTVNVFANAGTIPSPSSGEIDGGTFSDSGPSLLDGGSFASAGPDLRDGGSL